MATVAPLLLPVGSTTTSSSSDDAEMSKLKVENMTLKMQLGALQVENKELKKENEQLKKEKQQQTTRKRKTSSDGDDGEQHQQVSKKAKTPAQRKKIFQKWIKALVRESAKTKITNGWGKETYVVTIKETTPWTTIDFQSIFVNGQDVGTKIQPTPDNKPTSQITIYTFDTFESIQKLFGDDVTIDKDGYKAQSWCRRNFRKSYKNGEFDGSITSLKVSFNKSKGTLQLEFEMETSAFDW